MEIKKTIISIMLLTTVFFASLIYADTNGIWQEAEDLRGGTFGSDELSFVTSYTFVHPVIIEDSIEVTGELIVDEIHSFPGESITIQIK